MICFVRLHLCSTRGKHSESLIWGSLPLLLHYSLCTSTTWLVIILRLHHLHLMMGSWHFSKCSYMGVGVNCPSTELMYDLSAHLAPGLPSVLHSLLIPTVRAILLLPTILWEVIFFLLQVLGSLILESWKIRWPVSPATHYARPIRTPFNTMMNFVDVLFLFYYTTFQLHWPSFTRHDSDITSFNSYYRPTKELYRENWESESPSNLPQLHHQQVSGQRSKLQILMLSNTSCTWGPLRNLLYSQLPFPVCLIFGWI